MRWQTAFSPWRWSRWGWVLATPLAIAVYLLSAVPTTWLVTEASGIYLWGYPKGIVSTIYAPAWWCKDNSEIVADVFMWEWSVVDSFTDHSQWEKPYCTSGTHQP